MNLASKILTTAAVATLATTGIATAADAPVVTKQHTIAGAAPFTIPGTGVQKGEWMGSKAVLIYRDVTLEGQQETRVTLRAPKGKTLRGLAVAEGSPIGFAASDRNYVGKRSVTVRVYHASRNGDAEETGRIAALVR